MVGSFPKNPLNHKLNCLGRHLHAYDVYALCMHVCINQHPIEQGIPICLACCYTLWLLFLYHLHLYSYKLRVAFIDKQLSYLCMVVLT